MIPGITQPDPMPPHPLAGVPSIGIGRACTLIRGVGDAKRREHRDDELALRIVEDVINNCLQALALAEEEGRQQ